MARPAIRCFSTDIPPLSCDVIYPSIPESYNELVEITGSKSCKALTHHARRFDLVPTGPCDCHVQDIACLGCGNVVGYYIHRPCFRCLAQRLRIKQRGYQHLWTFYYEDVLPVQRKSVNGMHLSWEDLSQPNSVKNTPQSVSASSNNRSISNTSSLNSGLNIRQENSDLSVAASRGRNVRVFSENNTQIYQFPELQPTPSPRNSTQENLQRERVTSSNTQQNRVVSNPNPQQSLLFANIFQRNSSQSGVSGIFSSQNSERTRSIVDQINNTVERLNNRDSSTNQVDVDSGMSQSLDTNLESARGRVGQISDIAADDAEAPEMSSSQINQLVEISQQRIVAERVLANPRSSREAQVEALNTLSRFRSFQLHRSLAEVRSPGSNIGVESTRQAVEMETPISRYRMIPGNRVNRSRLHSRSSLSNLTYNPPDQRPDLNNNISEYQITSSESNNQNSQSVNIGRDMLSRRNAISIENRDTIRSNAQLGIHDLDDSRSLARQSSRRNMQEAYSNAQGSQNESVNTFISQRTVQNTSEIHDTTSQNRSESRHRSNLGINNQNHQPSSKVKSECVPPAIMTWLLQSGFETMPRWESSTVVR
ncbi:Protein FAM72A [Smittium culicis]|uniref:Protein FAM72A n=1 Tax=Smittium culicis TaxID=133412 RepID=A0A1R1WZ47_9FUNG|nr:Protein FAM72A [Smittium culicis]OMJ08332.1 Protein FAM72A [Smittium culicis]